MSYLKYQLTADGSTILLTTIANPKGGVYTSEDNETGAIVIALPPSWAGNMSKLKIDVSQLTDNLSFALSCTGEAPDTTWQNCSAQIIGNKSSNNRVRFGYSEAGCRAGEPARPVIVIGDVASTWTSPKIVVSNFLEHGRDYDIGHINIDWDIQILDDLTGYVFDVDIPDALLDAKGIINQGDLATTNEADADVLNMTNAPAEAGADKTSNQFTQSLGTIDSTTVNFNGRNDRDDSAITVPAIATDGTAIDHTINTDGSADISFEWSWGGTESDIDGFVVYVRGSTSSASYDFGTTPSEEITFYCRPDRRHFILKGVAANLYWTFGVSVYRVVDPDVNTNGFIATSVIQPSASGEDPYRPSANVAFAGNITGTVNDQSVSSVVYHDGSVIKLTDGTGINADSLPESTARKWAGESGADVTPPLPPDENLVGYWSFDEGQGTIARDSSGNNNTGTLNGGPGWVDGVAGKALNFDGTDDCVDCGNKADFEFATGESFSIGFWIKAPDQGDKTNDGVVTKGYATTNENDIPWYLFRLGGTNNPGNGKVDFYLRDSNSNDFVVVSTSVLDDSIWHYIVGVYNSATAEIKLYIDGINEATTGLVSQDAYGTNSGNLVVGEHNGNFFQGKADEVRIYNTALTPSQIKALFLNPGGNKAPIPGADKTGDHSADIDALQTTNAPAEAGADVTNYEDTRVANAILDSDCLTVAKPIGGAYSSSGNPDTGAIVVHLPQGYTSTMMSFFIDVFNYESNISFSIFVGGYNYSGGPHWARITAKLLGSTAADNRVRFGNDGSKCCVIIGDTDSDWYYPKVTVHGFRAGFSNYSVAQWETGWDVTIEDDLSGYTTDVDYSDALIDANNAALANNTTYVNDADTQSSHSHDIYGTLDLYYPSNGFEMLRFYDPNSTLIGYVTVSTDSQTMYIRNASDNYDQDLSIHGANTLDLRGNYIVFYSDDLGCNVEINSNGFYAVIDNAVSNGISDHRWSDVYTVNQHTGDVLFSDTHCAICGKPFKKDDDLIFVVKKIVKDKKTGENEVDCVPIHSKCINKRKELCKK